MPKRPIPSEESEEDEVKKARTDDSAPNGDNGAGPLMGKQPAAAATTSAAVTSPSFMLPTAASTAKAKGNANTPVAVSPSGQSASPKFNGSAGGGNKFLKSLRAMSSSSSTSNGESKPSSATTNGDAEKSNDDAAAGVPVDIKEEPCADSMANGTAKKEPVVPFPHLPIENESTRKGWIGPLIILFLFLLNMAAVIYIGSQQTWQNVIEMKYNLELDKLNEEYEASQGELIILRDRMNKLELAREVTEKMLAGEAEVFTGLFGPTKGGGQGDLLTNEERKAWADKFRLLESDKQSALNEFNENLSQFSNHIV